jgi:hypothetical protein
MLKEKEKKRNFREIREKRWLTAPPFIVYNKQYVLPKWVYCTLFWRGTGRKGPEKHRPQSPTGAVVGPGKPA